MSPSTTGESLTIYGAGNLGQLVAKSYRKAFPQPTIYGITRTEKNHDVLRSLGVLPATEADELPKTSHVLIAVPPKDDYLKVLATARKTWNGSGNLLLISSTRVYPECSGQEVNESSPVNEDSLMAQAEIFIQNQGGMVLRLAGLYDSVRGPHKAILRSGSMSGSPESFLNLIHTEDAAELSIRCLLAGSATKTYLGCDDSPLTRRHFAEIVLGRSNSVSFSASSDLGKRCNNQWTRSALQWQPLYKNFESFFASGIS